MSKYALILFAHHAKKHNLHEGDTIDLSYKFGEKGLNDNDMKILASAIQNKHFPDDFTINLRGNHITDTGAKTLYSALRSVKSKNLKINFSRTDITKEWRDKLQMALDNNYDAASLHAHPGSGGFFSRLRKSNSKNPLVDNKIRGTESRFDLN